MRKGYRKDMEIWGKRVWETGTGKGYMRGLAIRTEAWACLPRIPWPGRSFAFNVTDSIYVLSSRGC